MANTKSIAFAAACVGMIFPNQVAGYNTTNEVQTFYSRPDLSPPLIEVTSFKENLTTPGYFLITPYSPSADTDLSSGSGGSTTVEIQNGAYIYDRKGNLVYSGYGASGGDSSHNLKIVEYDGEPHLTYWNGVDSSVGDRGHGVIVNNKYHGVQTVASGLGRAGFDIHEFSVIENGTSALITIYQPTAVDLSSFGLDQPYGWVTQGTFQEIDIESGNVTFEWNSLEHVVSLPNASYNPYGSEGASNGTDIDNVWDYFHINSVEKDTLGNYIISSRYLCALFYISGVDGSVIWQINGAYNNFTFSGFENNTFPFAFQHHARIHQRNETTLVLSLFDNGSDGYSNFQNASKAMIVAVNEVSKEVTLLHQYTLQDDAGDYVLSSSQGNTQVLDNGNVVVGWGSSPFFSEFTVDGTLVAKYQYGAEDHAFNYRAFKANWTGFPDSKPAVWLYASEQGGSTDLYVSWNGATEVSVWKFYSAAGTAGGYGNGTTSENVLLAEVKKEGFETKYTSQGFVGYGFVEAVDAKGDVLGTSLVQKVLVGGGGLAQGILNR